MPIFRCRKAAETQRWICAIGCTCRRSDQEQFRHDAIRSAMLILSAIENRLRKTQPSCFVPVMAVADMARQTDAWWQEHACRVQDNGRQYYYVIEELGKDECARIKNAYNHDLIADYERVTLYRTGQPAAAKLTWQSTIAKGADDIFPCRDKLHEVIPGRQMLREI